MIRLTDDQLRAIGRIAVAFAAIEQIAYTLLDLFTGRDPRTPGAMESGESFTPVLRKLRDATQAAAGEALADEVGEWIDAAYRARDRRRRVMHWSWVSDNPWEPSPEIFKSWKERGQWRSERFTAEKLDGIAEQIDAVHSSGQDLLSPLMAARAHPLYRAKPSEWAAYPSPEPAQEIGTREQDIERLLAICERLVEEGIVARAAAWDADAMRVAEVGEFPEGIPPLELPEHLTAVWNMGVPVLAKPFDSAIYAPVFDGERTVGIVHGDGGRDGGIRRFGQSDLDRVAVVVANS
jgi:hypothetical protein